MKAFKIISFIVIVILFIASFSLNIYNYGIMEKQNNLLQVAVDNEEKYIAAIERMQNEIEIRDVVIQLNMEALKELYDAYCECCKPRQPL